MQVSTEMEGEDRWDCVRYLLAAAILVYMKVEDDEHHKTGEPAVNEDEWDRLTKSELDWAGPQEKKRSASPPDRLSRQATMAMASPQSAQIHIGSCVIGGGPTRTCSGARMKMSARKLSAAPEPACS